MNKRYYEHTLSTTREFIEYLPFSLHIIYKEGLLLSEGFDAEDFEQRSAVLAHQL